MHDLKKQFDYGDNISSQPQPMDFQRSGSMGRGASSSLGKFIGGTSSAPPTVQKAGKFVYDFSAGSESYQRPKCESLLANHGTCIANALRNAVTKGDSKGYLVMEDKCLATRGAFSRCIIHHREVDEGRRAEEDPTWCHHGHAAKLSRSSSGIFATTSQGDRRL